MAKKSKQSEPTSRATIVKSKPKKDPVKLKVMPTPKKTFSPPPKPATIQMVYVGISEQASRIGQNTQREYIFNRDEFGQIKPVEVHESDADALLNEKGKGCIRKMPQALFMTVSAWNAVK